jgi:hypothetical protein
MNPPEADEAPRVTRVIMLLRGQEMTEADVERLVEQWVLQAIKNGLVAERVTHHAHRDRAL